MGKALAVRMAGTVGRCTLAHQSGFLLWPPTVTESKRTKSWVCFFLLPLAWGSVTIIKTSGWVVQLPLLFCMPFSVAQSRSASAPCLAFSESGFAP